MRAVTPLWLLLALVCGAWGAKRPHILYIMADDWGWGDAGWSELADIPTPNMQKLRYEGLELMQYYSQPKCTAARAALMTGRYPYKMGVQTNDVFTRYLNSTLDIRYKLLPAYLKDLGYHTHMVGKWHLGHCNEQYTPIKRGFDTCFGPWANLVDRFTQQAGNFFDWNWNNEPYYQANGTFSTHLITNHTQYMLEKHFGDETTKDQPIFVYAPYLVPHKPPQVPEKYVNETCCSLIPETLEVTVDGVKKIVTNIRRTYCGMVAAMDEGIGNITKTLEKLGVLDDFIIIVTSDNGAAVSAGARAWPLRGNKQTVYEGGTRVRTLLRARKPFIGKRHQRGEYHGLIHVTDLLPTLFEAAGGNISVLPEDLDGKSAWQDLRKGKRTKRRWMVYNIDSERKLGAIRFKNATHNFKLIYSDKERETGYRPYDPRPLAEQENDPTRTRYPSHGQLYYFYDLNDNPNERPDNQVPQNHEMFQYMQIKLKREFKKEVSVIKYGKLPNGDHTEGGVWRVGGC